MIHRLIIVITSILLVSCAAAPKRQHPSASTANSCGDLGQSQTPKLAAGVYYVSRLDSSLYHISTTGTKPRLVSGADWSGTQSVTSLGHWLYIVQDGKLHRVHPETGEWFPKNFDAGDCRWYAGWSGPVWATNGKLYSVARNAVGTQQLLHLDFLHHRTTALRDYDLPILSIIPSRSTEVHK